MPSDPDPLPPFDDAHFNFDSHVDDAENRSLRFGQQPDSTSAGFDFSQFANNANNGSLQFRRQPFSTSAPLRIPIPASLYSRISPTLMGVAQSASATCCVIFRIAKPTGRAVQGYLPPSTALQVHGSPLGGEHRL
jgi:hypothetical protein